MRIVGDISHPTLKITLMHHGRYLLKLEDKDAEITYRFRDGEGVGSLADAEEMLNLGLLQDAERTLRDMSEARTRYKKAPAQDYNFPTII